MSVLLKTIANEANISTATVRRAINGDSRVRRDTRDKVQELVYRLGYRPNMAAKSLKLGLKENVGLVFACPTESDSAAVYFHQFASFLSHISMELENCGRSVLMTMAFEGITPGKFKSQLPRIAREGHTSQLIVMSHMWDTFAEELQRFRIKALVIDGPSCGLPVIQRDEELAAEMATDHLVALGHKRIAFVNHYMKSEGAAGYRDTLWPRGYLRSLTKHRLVPISGWDTLDKNEYSAVVRLLEMKERPTAIILYDEVMVMHFIKHLADAGISVPRDMSIISMRGSDTFYLPEITRVSVPHMEIAKAASDILERWNLEDEVIPSVIKIQGKIVLGGTAIKVNE